MPVVFHSYRIGPSTMKNRGSPAAFVGERVTSKDAIPPEGRRPSGGTETVTSKPATGLFASARSPAVATTRARARRTGAPGRLGIGIRMGPPPHPPAEGDERRAHIAAVPMPIPEEQEGRQEPRGLLERARDAVPEAGPGRPAEVRRHEESGDDPEDVGDAPRRVLDELEGHHEADRG